MAEQREVAARMRAEAAERAFTPTPPDEHARLIRDGMVVAYEKAKAAIS